MSKIVLCETKPAKVPYKIAKIGRSFQSYEEFCWLLEHYLIFFLTEGFEYPLKNYLNENIILEEPKYPPVFGAYLIAYNLFKV